MSASSTYRRPNPPPGAIHTGGGAYNPHDRYRYFLAGNRTNITRAAGMAEYVLMAINELTAPDDMARLHSWIDQGKKILIDSGIFFLTNEHMRSHPGMTMDEALALPPERIDGFNELWDRYLDVVRALEDRVWGYIELDQGGREQKIKTRRKLEKLGLRPIPVYHPLNDGWQYFDYLASHYDRICFGNVVQAHRPTRLRLLHTAWERHRKYPHLWIHLLGLTPNEWLNALPIDSADSSSWLVGLRWSAADRERADGAPFTRMPLHFRYSMASDPDSEYGITIVTHRDAFRQHINERNWRHHTDRLAELGFNPLPPQTPAKRKR